MRKFGTSRSLPGATLPCQPASTYALLSARDGDGREIAAVRGVLASVLGMINGGTTHVGVSTDHVIESFRNRLWPGYKTSAGVEPDLLAQFPLLEEAMAAMGIA